MTKKSILKSGDQNQLPSASTGDYAYTALKGIVGMIPIAGAPIAELLGIIVSPPLEKRRREWMEEIGNRLHELEREKKVNLETLRSDPKFIDTVIEATRIAIKTSIKEKLAVLRNIVVNTAVGGNPDESEALIFLALVDRFTILHIKVLKVLASFDPNAAPGRTPSLKNFILSALPELKSREDLLNVVYEDLKQSGLHDAPDIMTILMGASLGKKTTSFGDGFLRFITDHS